MPRFHPLEVTDIRRETRDAVVLTLKPRAEDAAAFEFTQGQYLTFRREFDGVELRRSYSICAGKQDGALRVGIKRVEGGAFSTWANEALRPCEILQAMPPMGAFHTPIEPEASKRYLMFAGGSGITPILSIVKTVLASEPKSRVTLVYANRQVSTIMFREEIEDAKNLHLGRLSVLHILKSDAQEVDLLTGRLDAEKCKALFARWIDVGAVDMAFICGPEAMMLTIAASLREHGLEDRQIKFELFATGEPRRAKPKASSAAAAESSASCEAAVTLDGATRSFRMRKHGQSLLDAAIEHNLDPPYACKAGVCSTCRVRILEGEAEMAVNHALEEYEIRQGYVLACQSFPLTDRIAVSFDQ